MLLGSDAVRVTPLRQILRPYANETFAEDLPAALSLLAGNTYEVVFCDWRFHCGTWREALEKLQSLYPELPVIVVNQTAGTEEGMRECVEVLEAGAFDLLFSPLHVPTVLFLLEHAVASGEARALRAGAGGLMSAGKFRTALQTK